VKFVRRGGTFARAGTGLTASLVALALLATGCTSSRNKTKADAPFPKTVTLVVPFAAGGGTDIWARLIATALPPLLPGRPNIQVQNLPGGEGIPGNNRFAQQDPSNGARILVGTGSSYIPSLLGEKGVDYDFKTFVPLISNGTGSVLYVTKASGIKTVDDLFTPGANLRYGGISATGSDLGALVSFDLLKLPVKATFGFEGRGPVALALQRGELTIDHQTTSVYNQSVKPEVAKGNAIPLMSYGVLDPATGKIVRDPNFPDLPTVPEVYEKHYGSAAAGAAYEAYLIFGVALYAFEKTLWAKPDTPAAITQPYVDAVAGLNGDAKFQQSRTAALGQYPLVKGSEVADVTKKVFNITPDVRAYVKGLLKDKYDTTVE
jgi:tripartite-type tricarboxylate transporter receptor subunit TctC